MSLKALAESDLGLIIENQFDGWPMVLTAPDGTNVPLVGLSFDISQVFDPETGQAVSGRQATVSVRTGTVLAAGKGLPQNVQDSSGLPWLVTVEDANSTSNVFKVSRSDPDRTIGMLTLFLEVYDA